ncbi:MAG: cadmium ABC transporter ATPase [Rhodopseudomonas sp.]|uniref:cadmium ABC transporter ATPase n=1 Tax=Rhodopseudomonas sp. TaxID=1078 RepID=UPI00183D09D9|nr:cadmium ABC transporter ATPase [Rhodopseudomonas sp.]NVN85219.1 cadmium ABC transporter ATPase [Rhodopseudomonas sp.]
MPGEELNLFQIAVRLLLALAIGSYALLWVVRLMRYLGGIIPVRPRVVSKIKPRPPPQR